MIESAKNKAVQTPGNKREYHFAGSGIYLPCNVVADSLQEATKEWEAVRVPVAGATKEEPTVISEDLLDDKTETTTK